MEPAAWNVLPRIGENRLFPTTPARLLDRARRTPHLAAYAIHTNDRWITRSWGEYRDEVLLAARALIAAGAKAGQAICILGFNRPEWCIIAHAAMMISARPAGIYWTAAPREVAYIVDHSGAPFLFLEKEANTDVLAEALAPCKRLRSVVQMEAGETAKGTVPWNAFLSEGAGVPESAVHQRLAAIAPVDIGSLIYTSGTTGPPKAVMLSHGALAWTADVLCRAFEDGEEGRGLSYLPLAHIAEQQASIHCHPNRGSTIYFARSMETLAEDIKAARPTSFFGVPRVWEKMADGVKAKLAEASPAKRRLASWAMAANAAWHKAARSGRRPSLLVAARRRLAASLVTDKVKAAMGLGETKTFISGAAPISLAHLKFFAGLDMPIVEGYGQSETAAPISANLPGAVRLGSVGRVFDGIEWRIADEGELQVRGPGLFSGYLADPAATRAAHTEDGWLKTGDVVHADEAGFLTIKGRIKDILITSGGKNVTPSNIESDLMALPPVEHAVVVGDGRHYLSALVTLSPEVRDLARADIARDIEAGIAAVNRRHARAEHIRKFEILPAPLTVEGGELTPTMKVRRALVIEKNAALIEAMYKEPAPVPPAG